MLIREFASPDMAAAAAIIMPVIRDGSTFALDPHMSESSALGYWLADDKQVFVAEEAGTIVGTYYLRRNQAGGGSHMCNCGYMTAAFASGRGVARIMCEHSLALARSQGFLAMQFNFVVESNRRAVALWQRMGFEIVGRLPKAFCHPTDGYVDALIMHRPL